MSVLRIIPLLFDDTPLINHVLPELTRHTGFRVFVDHLHCDVSSHYTKERGQFNAATLLGALEEQHGEALLLVLTAVDIYLPIFTFVFGAAHLGGSCAIVSSHRLEPTYYGLPPDTRRYRDRMLKECIHEVGHLCGLRHCPDYSCVMHSSTSADELDVKGSAYCPDCTRRRSLLPHR